MSCRYAPVPDISLGYLLQRCVKVKGCLVWNLRVHMDRPVATIERVQWQMRRVVWTLATECDVHPGYYAVPRCGNPHCLHPDHLVLRRRNEDQIGLKRSTVQRHHMALSMRKNSVIPQEVVAEIKACTGKLKHISAAYDISLSHAGRIRNGEARRDYLGSFAQMVGVL
ncbi:hypothetical protein [Polaromonas sp.]|uniref:hypothetical protein n=1 Tax=Polaromonas sp. TaxID=1869339 RepID=UPI003263068F